MGNSQIKVDIITKNEESEITISSPINAGTNKIKTSAVPTTGVDLVNYTYIQPLEDLLYINPDAIHAVTADYQILDDDRYIWIIVDPASGDKTITLPTLADNQGRELIVSVSTAGGKVTIDGEGTELIDDTQTLALQSQYDFCKLIGTATCWFVISCRAKFDTGWISSNDQTNRHCGVASLPFDGAIGTLLAGELVTEETTNNTGIVISGMAGTPLLLKNMTGTGVSTNDKTWTGSTSGASVEANLTSKNLDSNVAHNFGRSLADLKVMMYWSSDKTEANCGTYYSYDSGGNIGWTAWGVDTNNIKVQTGSSGLSYIGDAGASTAITASDWYYKVVVFYIK